MSIKPEILAGWGPGGWLFYQPETNWHAPNPLGNNFKQQVANIIEMRKQNPRFNLSTDEATVSAELEAYTEARWAKVYSSHGMRKFRVESFEDKKKGSNVIRSLSNKLNVGAVLAAGVKAVAPVAKLAGMDLWALEEWLGDGARHVTQEHANKRAAICAACPANKTGWRQLLTAPAAAQVKRYLEAKHQKNLSTPYDSKLEECAVCHCILPLKVWQDLQFVDFATSEAQYFQHYEANENCWVYDELT